jgi:hypothetical protein
LGIFGNSGDLQKICLWISGNLGIWGIFWDLEGAPSLEILANLHRFAGIFRDL